MNLSQSDLFYQHLQPHEHADLVAKPSLEGALSLEGQYFYVVGLEENIDP